LPGTEFFILVLAPLKILFMFFAEFPMRTAVFSIGDKNSFEIIRIFIPNP